MAPVEHNLPAEHMSPIGRDAEAAAVRFLLLNPATPLVGPGGMGKTTLALHLAHDTLDQVLFFPEPGQEVTQIVLKCNAKGPLRAAYGVPDGTPGRANTTQVAKLKNGSLFSQ